MQFQLILIRSALNTRGPVSLPSRENFSDEPSAMSAGHGFCLLSRQTTSKCFHPEKIRKNPRVELGGILLS